jgi:ParB-like chromosome segregation protein Spo0J
MKLKLKQIRTDGGTQARVRMCQETIAEYASKMSDGVVMPPVVVFFDKTEYWLADGFHRYFAAKSNGDLEIECDVHDGTVEDAMLYSFSANGGRGLSMTAEDNYSIVSRMLAHPKWKSWTDSAIAKHIHVSNSTVGRIRRKLEEAGTVEKKTEKKYTDKHGNEATMKVGNIGKTKKTKEDDLPKAPEPESSGDLIQELTDTISALSEENTLLKDKIAIEQWDASEIEKMDAADTIKELREQVRVLEIENKSLKENRDMYMNRNAELTRTVKSLQAKLNKLEN